MVCDCGRRGQTTEGNEGTKKRQKRIKRRRRTPRANLSAALHWLNLAYSVWWNRRHLFQPGQVVRAVEEACGQKWAEFAHRHGDWGLPLALYVARPCTGVSLRALGEAAGGLDYKAVFMSIQRLAKDKPLAKLAQQLINERQT